jgi:hypothetical protein
MCPRYNRVMVGRLREMCRGENVSPSDASYFRAKWEREAGPPKPWPLFARGLRLLRANGDAGIGDTVARNLHRLGADAMVKLYARLVGRDCGCEDRRQRLNQLFPYA